MSVDDIHLDETHPSVGSMAIAVMCITSNGLTMIALLVPSNSMTLITVRAHPKAYNLFETQSTDNDRTNNQDPKCVLEPTTVTELSTPLIEDDLIYKWKG